ncbi:MAG TPA: hypothetical protein VGP46_00570 [Acidimicrobiales bacterium]|nr:hypothetical protein [Acidimicrobiales bacterium]
MAGGCLAGVMLGGCGSSGNGVASKSATQIVNTAIAAMRRAQSVHIAGTITQSGKVESLDISLYSDGDADGSVTTAGQTLQIIKIGTTDYINASAAFYQSHGETSSIAGQMGGKWIEEPDSQVGVGSEFSVGSFANSISKHTGTLSKAGTSTVSGQSVVGVRSSKGGTIYIQTNGTAYPVEFVGSSKTNGSGTLMFSEWNSAPTPKAPRGARSAQSFG